MAKAPRKKKPEAPAPSRSIFPVRLRAGNRFTDETGEWEVVSLPKTSVGAKTVRARVRKVGEPAVIEQRMWVAHERITVRRLEILSVVAWENISPQGLPKELALSSRSSIKSLFKEALMANGRKAAADALAGVHVLVVDDDEDSLVVMQTTLEYAGALVMTAGSAKAAFEAFGRFTPDVIVADLRMPGQDGLSFARDLQRIPSLRTIPVLAVTGYDELYVRRDLHDAGFIGILRKPLTFPDLVQAVGALAETRKTTDKQQP